MATATAVRCQYEQWVGSTVRGYLKECQTTATWVFSEAPYGTADPRRQGRYLCTRHYKAWRTGGLNATYIETDTPRKIES